MTLLLRTLRKDRSDQEGLGPLGPRGSHHGMQAVGAVEPCRSGSASLRSPGTALPAEAHVTITCFLYRVQEPLVTWRGGGGAVPHQGNVRGAQLVLQQEKRIFLTHAVEFFQVPGPLLQ